MSRKFVRGTMIFGTIAAASLNVCGCGSKLILQSDQVEVELGSPLNNAVENYVDLDADEALNAEIDFSAVDVMKTGTYTAVVTYKEQTAELDVIVKDTTAPRVEAKEAVSVAAGEPLYASDIITDLTELSGAVETGFRVSEDGLSAEASQEMAIGEENVHQTETAEMIETTQTAENTEEGRQELESFLLNDVVCENAQVCFSETGEHDLILVVADASGNSTEIPVHAVVGTAPKFEGVKDITVTVGDEEIHYLDGITAVDCNGDDITDKIVCDTSAVDLKVEGAYEVVYTVIDETGFQAEEKATVSVTAGKAGSNTKKASNGSVSNSKNSTISENSHNSSGNSNTTKKNTSAGNTSTSGTASKSTSDGSAGTGGGNSEAQSTNMSGSGISGGNTDTSGSSMSGGSADASGVSNSTPGTDTNDGNSSQAGGSWEDQISSWEDQNPDLSGGWSDYDPSQNDHSDIVDLGGGIQ